MRRREYQKINFLRSDESNLQTSNNCPTPFFKRTYPKIPIVFRPDQVPPKIESVVDPDGIGNEI
jgi:hypothetical protein